MKAIWKPRYPLAMFLIAETDADRVLVAMMRKTSKVQFYSNAPQEIFEEARKISHEEPNERAAKTLMDEDSVCSRHRASKKEGCADCLGLVAFVVKPELDYSNPPVTEEPPKEDGMWDNSGRENDIPF